MRVDGGIGGDTISELATRAKELEDIGYDGIVTAETAHDRVHHASNAQGAPARRAGFRSGPTGG